MRSAVSFIAVALFWSALLGAALLVFDWPLWWGVVVGLALAVLQWLLAGRFLESMYRITWISNKTFEELLEDGRHWRFGVIDGVRDPWCMTYLYGPGQKRTVVTSGLTELFADDPPGLKGILRREISLGQRSDLMAATAVGTAILLCGVTEEFFLGAGRAVAFQRGLGGGVFIGFMAQFVGRAFGWIGDRFLARSGRSRGLADVFMKIGQSLVAATSTPSESLARGYAARAGFFAPVDAVDAARLALLSPDPLLAEQRGFSAWTDERSDFRDELCDKRENPEYPEPYTLVRYVDVRPWQVASALNVIAFLLGLTGLALTIWMHQSVACPFIGLALGWIIQLSGRYPSLSPQGPVDEPGKVSKVTVDGVLYPVVSAERPWFPAYLLKVNDEWLVLRWRPVAGPFEALLPPPPLDAICGVPLQVKGWLRWEREKVIEPTRIQAPDRVLHNRTLAVHYLLAVLLLLTGVLIAVS